MTPNILIYAKELQTKSFIDVSIPYMHLVGEVDGQIVRFIKNRFDTTAEISLDKLEWYLGRYLNYFVE
jgi:hypothetical protein